MNEDRWGQPIWLISEMRADPYVRDCAELGTRVADCYETNGPDLRSLISYLDFWCGVAQLNAMMR